MGRMIRRVCGLLVLLVFACCVLPLYGQGSPNPIPLINDPLVPTSVAPGGAGFTLTVNGTGFVSSSVVKWDGTALSTTFVSGSKLTASVLASEIASAGSAWVTVTNPAPGGGTSLPAFLRIATPVMSPSFVSYIQGTSFDGQTGIYELITGDFNGDRKLDLAFLVDTLTSAGNDVFSVCVELGNGDGSFQSPVCQPAGAGQFLQWVVAGDFNGDGKLDLAVTWNVAGTPTGTVSVFLGNGDGTLQAPVNSPAGNGPFALAAGDFNRDGKLDLAVLNEDTSQVPTAFFISVLLGNGDGTFQNPVTYASGLDPNSLVVGDFNGDGNLDIVFIPEVITPPTLYFLAGKGDGTFQAPQQGQTISESAFISAAADVNGDGKLDLLLTDPGGNLAVNSILLGNGDGTFQTAVDYPLGSGSGGNICRREGLSVDDLNADGKLDLAFCQGVVSLSVVGFQLGNGDGMFQAATDLTVPPKPPVPQAIATGDFNGDGRVDMVNAMAFGPSNSLLVFLQGSFPVASATPTKLTFPQQAMGIPSTPEIITLSNNGTIPVTFSGVALGGANAADFAQTNTCGGTLAGGATCRISVTFTPTVPGNPVATMSISDSSVGSPQTVVLTGSTLGPGVGLSPSSIAFTSQYVGTSGLPQTVTVSNIGTGTLTITTAAASSADFGILSNCSNPVASGASCTIGVFFDPTASGTRSGTLTITDNAAGSPQTVTLTGSGSDFSMAPSSAASATVTAGQTANYSIAVAPAGGFAQTVALSCSGGPAGSTCSVSPNTIALSGAAAKTAMVTVTTAGSQGWVLPFGGGWPGKYRLTPLILALAGMLLLIVVAFLLGRREQRFGWARVFALALLGCLAMTLTSCGGGSGGGGTNPGAGTYTVTVAGNFTSGSTTLSHATQLTLVIH